MICFQRLLFFTIDKFYQLVIRTIDAIFSLNLGLFESLTPVLFCLQPHVALKPGLLPCQLKMLHVFILSGHLMPPMLAVFRTYLLIAVLAMQVLHLVFMGPALLIVIYVISLIVT